MGTGPDKDFTDALGSVTSLGMVAGGTAVSTARYEYDAWGEVLDAPRGNANRRGYTGQYRDEETGLVAMGNGTRYYDPDIGRFTQQDTWMGAHTRAQTMNRYAYAVGNPLAYVDPTGREPETIAESRLAFENARNTGGVTITDRIDASVMEPYERATALWAAQSMANAEKAVFNFSMDALNVATGHIALSMAIDLTGQGFQETVNDAIDVKYGLMDPLEYAAKGSLAERATANIGLNMQTALAAIPVVGMVLGKLGKGIAKAARKADDVPGASAVKRYDEAYSAPGASKRSTAAREADNLTLSRSRAAGDAPGSARAQRTAVSRPKGVSGGDGRAGDNGGILPQREQSSQRVFYVDKRGVAIPAQRDSVFRANAVTPEIDASISERGFLTGRARGVSQSGGAALPDSASQADRIVQYVEGKPFPRDANFVGFKRIPHDALATALKTGRATLKDPNAFVRLDEVNTSGLPTVDVEAVYRGLGRSPRPPLDVFGESVVEGSVPANRILTTYRMRP